MCQDILCQDLTWHRFWVLTHRNSKCILSFAVECISYSWSPSVITFLSCTLQPSVMIYNFGNLKTLSLDHRLLWTKVTLEIKCMLSWHKALTKLTNDHFLWGNWVSKNTNLFERMSRVILKHIVVGRYTACVWGLVKDRVLSNRGNGWGLAVLRAQCLCGVLRANL